MPPRIRSPTPSEEEVDELAEDSPPPPPPPVRLTTTLPTLPPSTPTTGGTRIKIRPPLPPPPAPAPASVAAAPPSSGGTPASSSSRTRATRRPQQLADYDQPEDDDEGDAGQDEEFDELAQSDELRSDRSDQDPDDDSEEEGDYTPSGTKNRSKRKKATKGSSKTTAAKGRTATGRKRNSSVSNQTPQRQGRTANSSRRSSVITASQSTSATGADTNSGIKIKFKLGGGASQAASGHDDTTDVRTHGSAGSTRGKGGSQAKGKSAKGKGKGKRKAGSDDDDSEEVSFDSDGSEGFPLNFSDSNGDEDEVMADGQGGEYDELDDELNGGYSSGGASSSAAGSSIYGGRKTARQRAKEMGGDEALELMSLPNRTYNKPAPPVLTAEEIALQKAEKSRKRKHQADKKLEDEKTETINRLLKKQVGKAPTPSSAAAHAKKAGKSKLSKSITADGSEDEGEGQAEGHKGEEVTELPIFVKASVARWVSSVKEGEYKLTYSVPEGRSLITNPSQVPESRDKKTRTPPRTRIFTPEEKEHQRRLNRCGWEKVMLGVN